MEVELVGEQLEGGASWHREGGRGRLGGNKQNGSGLEIRIYL